MLPKVADVDLRFDSNPRPHSCGNGHIGHFKKLSQLIEPKLPQKILILRSPLFPILSVQPHYCLLCFLSSPPPPSHVGRPIGCLTSKTYIDVGIPQLLYKKYENRQVGIPDLLPSLSMPLPSHARVPNTPQCLSTNTSLH